MHEACAQVAVDECDPECSACAPPPTESPTEATPPTTPLLVSAEPRGTSFVQVFSESKMNIIMSKFLVSNYLKHYSYC